MIVWISLLIRKALLLIAIVFAPIALAGSSWDHTRGWVSKWASFVIALILSKVVLVVIFLLATAQVSAPIDGDLQSVSEPIAGVVLMLMAGFAPYMTYKAISFMGFDMYHAMSAEQEAKSALNRPVADPDEPRSRLRAEQGARRRVRSGGRWRSLGRRPPAPHHRRRLGRRTVGRRRRRAAGALRRRRGRCGRGRCCWRRRCGRRRREGGCRRRSADGQRRRRQQPPSSPTRPTRHRLSSGAPLPPARRRLGSRPSRTARRADR